jgi:hypothetical protein
MLATLRPGVFDTQQPQVVASMQSIIVGRASGMRWDWECINGSTPDWPAVAVPFWIEDEGSGLASKTLFGNLGFPSSKESL